MSKADIQQVFEDVDRDGNGTIDFEELDYLLSEYFPGYLRIIKYAHVICTIILSNGHLLTSHSHITFFFSISRYIAVNHPTPRLV